MEYFNFFDLFYALVICVITLSLAKKKAAKLFEENKAYQYYVPGLRIKLFASIAFCLIYLLYYQGGDTLAYWRGIEAHYNVFLRSPGDYLSLLFESDLGKRWYTFDHNTGYPPFYMLKDSRTLLVIRIGSLLSFVGLGGYISTSVLLASLFYRWLFKGFLFVANRYKEVQGKMALCYLYFPSAAFWASGILKDTFTFAAACFCLYGANEIFFKKQDLLKNGIQLIVAMFLTLYIKSYILFALLPGLLIFLNYERLKNVKSTAFKYLSLPIGASIIVVLSQSFFSSFSADFGKYSVDKVLKEASVQQQDLLRAESYGTNSFDIGTYDATFTGVLGKAPVAINAALFRPYLWEVGSPTMLISAIENTVFLIVSIYFLLATGPFNLLKMVRQDAYLIFALSFTLIMAFGIGLSTANFGALVRYKIPFLPFISSFLFVVREQVKKNEAEDESEEKPNLNEVGQES